MRTRFLMLALLVPLAIACGGQADEGPSSSDEPAATATAPDPAVTRPDPQNPLGEEGEVPPGWEVRFDRTDEEHTVGTDAESSDLLFTTMTPGWHITAHASGILYHPASTSRGAYRATTTLHLFDPGDRNEGYGLFIGGTDLEEDDQEYLYFLVRRSGEFLVKLREGADTRNLMAWTPHEAIVKYDHDLMDTATNTLTIEVGMDEIVFHINDQEVARLGREGLPTAGISGLRINHAVNVHVSEFGSS